MPANTIDPARVTALEGAVATINTKINNLEQGASSLTSRVSAVETKTAQLDALATRVATLESGSASSADTGVGTALTRIGDILADLKTALLSGAVVVGGSGGGTTGGTTGGGTTPPPVVNAYPVLTMADVQKPIVEGVYPTQAPSEIELGVPGNSVIFFFAGTAGPGDVWTQPALRPIEFDVWITDELGRHRVAHSVHCTGFGWGSATTRQPITINGNWGTVTQMDIVPSGVGYPDYSSFVAASLNGSPMYSWHDVTFWAGGSGGANGTATFYSANPGAVVAGSGGGTTVPVATPTTIGGATVNGASVAAGTLNDVVKAATDASTLQLPTGVHIGTALVPVACTIRGVSQDLTTVDCTGLTPTFQKGVFVPTTPGTVFEDMTIKGGAVSDNNGAGIRDEVSVVSTGCGFAANRVRFTGNQDGVLTFGGRYIFNDCIFDHNGAGDGQSHNFYIGGQHVPTSYVELNDCISHNALGGHAFKSRASTGRVFGGVYTHGVPDDVGANGNDAASVNIPVAGDYVFAPSKKDGSPTRILIDTTKASMRGIIQYGVDWYNDADATNALAAGNAGVGTTLDLGPSVIETIGATPGFIQGPKWATIILTNVKYKGVKPDLSAWLGTIIGDMTPA